MAGMLIKLEVKSVHALHMRWVPTKSAATFRRMEDTGPGAVPTASRSTRSISNEKTPCAVGCGKIVRIYNRIDNSRRWFNKDCECSDFGWHHAVGTISGWHFEIIKVSNGDPKAVRKLLFMCALEC